MKRVSILILALLVSITTWALPTSAQTSPVTSGAPSQGGQGQSTEITTCTKQALGSKYDQVKSGAISPEDLSEAELDAVENCFSKNTPPPPPDDQKNSTDRKPDFSKMASQTKECLEKKLGADWQTKMAAVKSSKEGKTLGIHTCFGAITLKGGPNANDQGQPGPGGIPDDVKQCIIKTVGQSIADEIFSGDLPDGSIADKIEGAGCFKSFGPPPPGENGKAPQMSAEGQECFKKITGTTPDKRPKLNKTQLEQLNKECFKGGPGAPGAGGPPPLPESVKACFAEGGLDVSLLTKGPDLLTETQKQVVGSCFQKNNFAPQGPANPNGPQGPNGPGGNPPQMSEDVKKCIEGILGAFSPDKQPNDEQKQRIGKECFKGGPGAGGPNGPGPNGQGGPGPQLPDDKRICVEKIAQNKPLHELAEDLKRQVQLECFGGVGGPGPNGPNQPGPQGPNQPGPNGPQGPGPNGPNNQPNIQQNFPPNVQQCARDKAINLENPDKEALRRLLNEQCPLGEQRTDGQPGIPGNQPPPNGQQPGPQGPPPEGQPQGLPPVPVN